MKSEVKEKKKKNTHSTEDEEEKALCASNSDSDDEYAFDVLDETKPCNKNLTLAVKISSKLIIIARRNIFI
jgi:hypothetical protein